MLSFSIRQQAGLAIHARFVLRDNVLAEELQKLASSDLSEDDGIDRLGIRLRLICEHDLFERAFIVWNNIKRAHEDFGAVKYKELMRDFLTEARLHMKEATLNLATHLGTQSEALAGAFQGPTALDAKWLGKLRDRSIEKYSSDMEDYISGLSWGIKSLLGSKK